MDKNTNETQKETIVKVKPNTAVGIFLVGLGAFEAYYLLMYIIKAKGVTLTSFIVLTLFIAVMFFYFLGCRPYEYVIKDKTVISKKRLMSPKEVDLMTCEVICDPVSRMADLVTRPHAIEIYTDTKKRHCYFPADPIAFVGAVVASNKRIHCTVEAYTDIHRSIEKKERKERKRAQRQASKGAKKDNE